MKLSDQGLQLLRDLEGLRLKAYQDTAGVWTIGYGDTGSHVKPGDVITRDEAERRLSVRAGEFAATVLRVVKRPMTQNQFEALVHLTYNIGSGGLTVSDVVEHFNAGDVRRAAKSFGDWIHRKGELIVLRRGDSGDQVAHWQRKLRAAGIALKVDGDFGPATENATRLLQAKRGEPQDGIARTSEKVIDRGLVARRIDELVRFLT
jgi:lysozyme